ncbi:MAG: hypothetical protein V3V16_12230 [Melioribacteraceae bacterium]
MIVVDTNTIAYFWIKGAYTKYAKNLLRKDSEWDSSFFVAFGV